MAYLIFSFILLYLALGIEECLEVTYTHKMMFLHMAHTGCGVLVIVYEGGVRGA
jgi:hypothetical protein